LVQQYLGVVVRSWLVLVHSLPPEPAYLRVKLRRRLARLGAVPLKSSVYVLPNRGDALEDFQWLASEIRTDGGDAVLCEANVLDGASDDDLIAQFNEQADGLYAGVAADARDALERVQSSEHAADVRAGARREHTRLAKQLADATRVDYFGATARADANAAVDALRDAAQPATDRAIDTEASPQTPPRRGTVWVTRADVFVDRLASAWLIRRFIDPRAKFKFVTGVRYAPQQGEVRFDMPRGEYTHEGDRCTFEVLCVRFGLRDPGLVAVGEIVHDIDLKDDKFGRSEADGIVAVLRGIREAADADDARLQLAAPVFDGLYAQFRARG
jgi:hypothetical protein